MGWILIGIPEMEMWGGVGGDGRRKVCVAFKEGARYLLEVVNISYLDIWGR